MRILVTGSTGSLGSAVANYLCSQGWDVTGTGRNVELAGNLMPGVRFVVAELSRVDEVDLVVREHDAIIHCAALSSAWGAASDFQTANVDATVNLLNSALKHQCKKFVFISTPSVYFDFTHKLNIKEEDRLASRPVNNYAWSKLSCEKLVASANAQGLATVILRPRGIFGPHDRSLMPRLLRLAQKGWLPLIDRGRALIDLTYVDNVAHAVSLALEHLPAVSGKTYNISNGEPITLSALFNKITTEFKLSARCITIPYEVAFAAACTMEAVAMITPGCPEPLLTKYTVGVIGRSQTLSIEASRRDLNYEPLVSLEHGIQLTADYFNSPGRESAVVTHEYTSAKHLTRSMNPKLENNW